MKRHNEWKPMLGILLAVTMLLGCFVPIIYGAYKVYDKGNQQVIVVRMMETPETVYKTAIATTEERGGKIDKRDDKEMLLTGKTKGGQEAILKVSSAPQGGSELTITLEKGKDPKAEREEIVNTVVSVCSKLGIQCSEEKEKK